MLLQSVFGIGCWMHTASKSVDTSPHRVGRIAQLSSMVFNLELAAAAVIIAAAAAV
jgi:hypothetical protein